MSEGWPWTRPFGWPDVPRGDRTITLVAGDGDRVDIARQLDLETLSSLSATITVRPWLDGVELDGRLQAEMTRVCGVSLEPFEVIADEPIRIRVVPQGSSNAPRPSGAEIIIELDEEDPPDEADGATIDLAGYVVEALALSLDPFPRKPGAVFESPRSGALISPFAVLATIDKRRDEV